MSNAVDIVRVYTDDDGQTLFDDTSIELEPGSFNGGMSEAFRSSTTQIRTIGGEFTMDFHVAPRRQFIINLAGTTEIEVPSGDRRTMPPGAILLVEDTTGQGHKSRKIDGDPLTCLIVRLD